MGNEPKRYPRKTAEPLDAQELIDKTARDLEELEGECKESLQLDSVPGAEQHQPPTSTDVNQPLQNVKSPLHSPPEQDPPPPTPSSLYANLPKQIHMAQDLAIKALIDQLNTPEKLKDLTPSQLLSILSQLEDIRMSREWTTKLEKAIQKKHNLLLPPNSPSQLTKKLQGHAKNLTRANGRDGREGASKLLEGLELPDDEDLG